MPNWFYYDETGTKRGPINDVQLKTLAASQKITPNTSLETDDGHKGKAGQVKWLFTSSVTNSSQSDVQPSSVSGTTEVFCTNCGNPVSSQAVACMKCGADPRKQRKFCRICGAALNPEQVVCVKCGAGIKVSSSQKKDDFDFSEKNKYLAAFLALVLGVFGVHRFYLGDKKRGIFYLIVTITSIVLGGVAEVGLLDKLFPGRLGDIFTMSGVIASYCGVLFIYIASIIDGVKVLCMKDEQFRDKYVS